ncbi:hypothetical protein KUH32_00120 [Thalassococcus sp. CAU 1522]|uniref:MFS transporter n=1 Tax=Thalassococcus arenae TaxID=2851652 RepID=A0ABS6N2B7_9RHOB|nr:MFS transporter [Thalassococcus arenae]MBV2358166.1 hypothetical protein [Thalassococcus arenae]
MTGIDHRAVIWAAGACGVMSGAAIAPAIPAIDLALSGAVGGGFWGRLALVLPAIVIMGLGPWIGRRTAGLDQRRGFAAALCALAGFGVLGGLATSHGWLLASRIGLGVSTAAVLCFATAALATLFRGPERAQVIDRQSAINTLGGVVFVLAGGVLAQLGWRVPFLLYLLALPVAWQAARMAWPAPTALPDKRPDLAAIRAPIVTLGVAMTAFYLVPVQAPFMPALSGFPSLAGLTIASATLIGGLVSWNSGGLRQAASDRVVEAGGLALLLLGLLEFGLGTSVPALLLAAGMIGAGFGALLPLTVQRILAQCGPDTAHAAAGLIASALYAGQVGASALAFGFGIGGPRLPFLIAAAGLGLGLFLWVNRQQLGPWRHWIVEHMA